MNYLSSAALAGIPDARVTPPAATHPRSAEFYFDSADYATRVKARTDGCLTSPGFGKPLDVETMKKYPLHADLGEDGRTLTIISPRKVYPEETAEDPEPWREFHEADLRELDLSGMDLSRRDFYSARLQDANLR